MEQVTIYSNSNGIMSGASFSNDKQHRLCLWRIWNTSLPFVMFIGLNPSKANENTNDNTMRKVVKIAQHNGYGGVYMVNLFTYTSTDPKKLPQPQSQQFAEMDKDLLISTAGRCKDVVFCWGNFKIATYRATWAIQQFPNALCLAKNKNGSPKHPLYCLDKTKFIPFVNHSK